MSPDNQNPAPQPTPTIPPAAAPAASATPAPQATAVPATPPPASTAAPITTPPATAPAAQASGSPAPQATCKCQTINPADWDKKKTTINKTFYKAFSPRIFFYPFSFVIDILRATKGAQAKDYKVVENGMIIDDCAMFLGNVMIEVTGANTNDPQVLSLEGKEVYTKVSRNDWKNIKLDIAELEKELGKKPAQLLVWWTSCPTCTASKEAKAVLIALP